VNVSSLFDVSGYGVIVTGGASGLGLAYGEVLAAHGARVTLIDLDADAVAAQAARLADSGVDVRGAVADVTDHATLDRVIDEAAETYGRLDVAFANAGIDPGIGFVGAWAGGQRPRVAEGALEQYTDERWNRVIDINLNGVFATVRAAARHMRARRFGRIIVTTSMAATHVEPAIGASYMTAKAGARHLMHSVALELAADGIAARVVSMPCMDRFEQQPAGERERVLGAPGTPRIAVEAASPFGWDRWTGERGAVIGMRTFGASAPEAAVYAHFGITTAAIVEQAHALLST